MKSKIAKTQDRRQRRPKESKEPEDPVTCLDCGSSCQPSDCLSGFCTKCRNKQLSSLLYGPNRHIDMRLDDMAGAGVGESGSGLDNFWIRKKDGARRRALKETTARGGGGGGKVAKAARNVVEIAATGTGAGGAAANETEAGVAQAGVTESCKQRVQRQRGMTNAREAKAVGSRRGSNFYAGVKVGAELKKKSKAALKKAAGKQERDADAAASIVNSNSNNSTAGRRKNGLGGKMAWKSHTKTTHAERCKRAQGGLAASRSKAAKQAGRQPGAKGENLVALGMGCSTAIMVAKRSGSRGSSASTAPGSGSSESECEGDEFDEACGCAEDTSYEAVYDHHQLNSRMTLHDKVAAALAEHGLRKDREFEFCADGADDVVVL